MKIYNYIWYKNSINQLKNKINGIMLTYTYVYLSKDAFKCKLTFFGILSYFQEICSKHRPSEIHGDMVFPAGTSTQGYTSSPAHSWI